MSIFVQYFDNLYNLKTKHVDFDGYQYTISGIDTPFFPVALYSEGKRLTGLSLISSENLDVEGFINDETTNDSSLLPEQGFFNPHDTVIFYRNQNDSSSFPTEINVNRHSVDVASVVRHQVDVMSMPAQSTVIKPHLIVYKRPTLVLKSFIGGSQSSRMLDDCILAKVTIRIYTDGSYDLLDNTVISNLVTNNFTTLNTGSRIASGKSFPFFNIFIKPVDISGGSYVFSDFTQFEIFYNLKTNEFAVVHRLFRLNNYGTEVELFYNNIIQNYTYINQGVVIKSPDTFVQLHLSNEFI